MLHQVGFFDSPRINGDQFDVLASALRQATSTTGDGLSLLVLPELFNLKEPYWPEKPRARAERPKCFPAKDSLLALQDLATAHNTTFICSLLADGFNEAYCVEPNSSVTLMCRKMNDDGSGNYTASVLCDPNNPLERDGMCIGALICLDALDCREETPDARGRRNRLLDTICGSRQQHRILCVPAHMSSHCMPGGASGITLIVASSGGLCSFVRSSAQKTLATREHARDCPVCFVRAPW
jgi:predicted amidohydrolase